MPKVKSKDLPQSLKNALKDRRFKSREISVEVGDDARMSSNTHAIEYDNSDYSYYDLLNTRSGKIDKDVNAELTKQFKLTKKIQTGNIKLNSDEVLIYGDRLDGYASLHMNQHTFDRLFGSLGKVEKLLKGSSKLSAILNKKGPQFNRTQNGSLYDRGSADSYYGRPRKPHWFPNGTGHGKMIDQLSKEEIKEYNQGYDDNEASGIKKEW